MAAGLILSLISRTYLVLISSTFRIVLPLAYQIRLQEN